jgi:hypothetical protein
VLKFEFSPKFSLKKDVACGGPFLFQVGMFKNVGFTRLFKPIIQLEGHAISSSKIVRRFYLQTLSPVFMREF